MILYHGTNCDIPRPDPRMGHAGTDFGQGFYLTPDDLRHLAPAKLMLGISRNE